jgi:hypothetical protein
MPLWSHTAGPLLQARFEQIGRLHKGLEFYIESKILSPSGMINLYRIQVCRLAGWHCRGRFYLEGVFRFGETELRRQLVSLSAADNLDFNEHIALAPGLENSLLLARRIQADPTLRDVPHFPVYRLGPEDEVLREPGTDHS